MEIVTKVDPSGYSRKYAVLLCNGCDKSFEKQLRFVKRDCYNYCTHKCSADVRKNRIKLSCVLCGIEVIRPIGQKNKTGLVFCSQKCKNEAQSVECGRMLQCGPSSDKTAYRNKALAYYPKCCEWCKFPILELLDIHHIDHDRNNNDLTNLIVLCVMCHAMETRNLVTIVNRLPVANDETLMG